MSRCDPKTIPFDVARLPLCRCADCRNWQGAFGCTQTVAMPYFPPKDVPDAIRRAWNDGGMVNPADWGYCLHYRGPKSGCRPLVLPTSPRMGGGRK